MNLNSITQKLKYGSRLRPARDWLVLLGIFVFGLGISIVFNLLTFAKVTQGQPVGNAPVIVPAQIQLDQVNTLFNARATERSRYDSEYHFVDPSL